MNLFDKDVINHRFDVLVLPKKEGLLNAFEILNDLFKSSQVLLSHSAS